MHIILRSLAFLGAFFYASALAANSCRACTGSYTIAFNEKVKSGPATDLFKSIVKQCTTGGDYVLTNTVGTYCTNTCTTTLRGRCSSDQPDPFICSTYTFSINAYRYCGNGGKVSKTQTKQISFNGVSASSVQINMSCYRSVQCAGDCDKSQCF